MSLFYATNGMSEMVSLFLLIGRDPRLDLLVPHARDPIRGGAVVRPLALGFLSRYELLLWASAAGIFIASAMIARRARSSAIEGTLITYFVPIAYAVGLWLFLNWTIVGSPLYWLHSETSAETGVTVAGHVRPSITTAVGDVLSLNGWVFLPTLVAFAALAAVCVFRRDGMAAGICIFLALNAAFTGLLFYASGNHQYLELRYNIRAMPAVIAGVAVALPEVVLTDLPLSDLGRVARVAARGISADVARDGDLEEWISQRTRSCTHSRAFTTRRGRRPTCSGAV